MRNALPLLAALGAALLAVVTATGTIAGPAEASCAGSLRIESALFDCNLDCTSGVEHVLNLTVRNEDSLELRDLRVRLENGEGGWLEFSSQAAIGPGETRTLSMRTLEQCTSLIRQTKEWFEPRIRRMRISWAGCIGGIVIEGEELESLLEFANCNQTLAMKSAYGVLIYHLNEGNGSSIQDSSDENTGEARGNFTWVG